MSHERCPLPPSGWVCSRAKGHEGSCAATPKDPRPLLTRLRDGALSDERITDFSFNHGLSDAATEGLYDLCCELLEEALVGPPNPEPTPQEPPTFEKELEQLINRHSIENGSNTPDFILAQYVLDCIAAFNKAQQTRAGWYEVPRCVPCPVEPKQP